MHLNRSHQSPPPPTGRLHSWSTAGRLVLLIALLIALSGSFSVAAYQDEDGSRGPRETPTIEVIPPTEVPPPPVTEPTPTPPPTEPTATPPSEPVPSEIPSLEPTIEAPSSEPTPSPSPSPEPSASTPNGSGTVVLSPGTATTATAGDTIEFVHTLTYVPLAEESGTARISVQGPEGWPISITTRGNGPALVDSDGDAILDQVTLCADAGNTQCSTEIVVRLLVPNSVAGNHQGSVVVSAMLLREANPADQNGNRVRASTTSTQLVTAANEFTIQATITLTITGGSTIDFGTLSPDGTPSGIARVMGEPVSNGAQYTYDEAVTINVTVGDSTTPWQASCYVASESPVMQSLELSQDSTTFTSPGSTCLSGIGDSTMTLDLRLTVTWQDTPGPVSGQIVFTVTEG